MDRLSLDIGKLRRMSHVELRGLAKSLHIKANQKTEKLRDAIMDHIATEDDDVTSDDVDEEQAEFIEATSEEEPKKDSFETVEQKCKETEPLTPSERKLRRRTYELTPSGQPNTSDTNEVNRNKSTVKNDTENTSSPLKTPKVNITTVITKCDRSVGRTPVEKRTYALRSKKDAVNGEGGVGGPVKSMIPRPMVKVLKKQATPNFAKIHQAAFNKLENLNEYVSKKEKLRANYKSFMLRTGNRKMASIKPTLNKQTGNEGSIFRPSVLSTAKMNLDFTKMNPPPQRTPKAMPPIAAKTPLKPSSSLDSSRPTFNLKESLARKLRYQPHKGPLKALTENVQSADSAHCIGHWKSGSHLAAERRAKERTENRDLLKGVRRNRRLDLQLKMRGVIG